MQHLQPPFLKKPICHVNNTKHKQQLVMKKKSSSRTTEVNIYTLSEVQTSLSIYAMVEIQYHFDTSKRKVVLPYQLPAGLQNATSAFLLVVQMQIEKVEVV